MSRTKTVHRCSECGGSAPKWAGRCPACQAWNTLVEERVLVLPGDPAGPTGSGSAPRALGILDTPTPIAEVELDEWKPRATGLAEVDRVLGGGLVPGSVTLLGGEPGVGKSTLLLQVLAELAGRGQRCLYVSAEESKQQVRLRADRLGTLRPKLLLTCETALSNVVAHLVEHEPEVLVVDSIQTVFDPDVASAPGTVAQVRGCAYRLVQEAKARDLTVILVGHVTKDGGLAGPRVLEHLVDTVLAFHGERHHALRVLRCDKNRFGPTDELGLFEMTGDGLVGVADPSELFLTDRRPGIAGSVVVPTMDGQRPLLVEVQSLLATTNMPSPRRSAQGVDGGRLGMLLAVLSERVSLPVNRYEVHCLAAGGVRLIEPGADLGVAVSIASSLLEVPVPGEVVVCGEIGLGGELRQASQLERRLVEAARLGFVRAVVPWSSPDPPPGMGLIRARTVGEALVALGIIDPAADPERQRSNQETMPRSIMAHQSRG